MTAYLAPQPVPQFFDNSGNPLAGGSLYTYAAGTSTPQVTYTDSGGGTPNANPIVLDAYGRCTYYLDASLSYKLVLKDSSGNTIWSADNQTGAAPSSFASQLAASTGTTLIGWIRSAVGAVATTVSKWMGWQPYSVFEFMTAAQIADVQAGTKTLDVSTACQAAITACYGKKLRFEPGSYKLVTALNILSRIEIDFSAGQATLFLATQNMNGIVIGDGTDPKRSLLFGTLLDYPAFAPMTGVTQFTSGACIYENYVAYITVRGPSFYGSNGSSRILYNGLQQLRASECDTPYILAQQLHGYPVYAEGQAGLANRTDDCSYDFARFISCDLDGMYWGANTAGLSAYRPEVYSITGWGIRINATAGPSGQNYFITDPDVEGDGTGGIYVQSGERAVIKAGWVGGNLSGGVLAPAIWIGASADSCVIDTTVSGGRVLIDGPATSINGGSYDGDSATAGVGIMIGTTADDCAISSGVRVRQWVGTGIGFTGTPARVNIGAVSFKNNGTDIASLSGYSAAFTAPVIAPCATDKAHAGYTAAATLTIPISVRFAQASGGTNITTINTHGLNARLTLQASGGAINVASGGNLQLKTSPTAITSGSTMSFVCDGVTWFEDGRSF